VASREIEVLLADEGLADPPTAARLARLAHGRPGLAIALARAPEVIRLRDEVARSLLDLLVAGRRKRLERVRELLRLAGEIAERLAASGDDPPTLEDVATIGAAVRPRTRGRGRATKQVTDDASPGTALGTADQGEAEAEVTATLEASGTERRPPVERRRAAQVLLETWREVARDLAVLAVGGRRDLDDPALIDELTAAASGLPLEDLAAFLRRLEETGRALEANANPELAMDVLVLAWPRARAA
jgi:hypothetical protein